MARYDDAADGFPVGPTPLRGTSFSEDRSVQERLERLERTIKAMNDSQIGTIRISGSAFIEDNELLCNGASYLRTDYADLYTKLGGSISPWGLPDGTHFQVPDFRGRLPLGEDVGALTGRLTTNNERGQSGGVEVVALTHAQTGLLQGGQQNESAGGQGYAWHDIAVTNHTNLQPYAVVNFFIRAFG